MCEIDPAKTEQAGKLLARLRPKLLKVFKQKRGDRVSLNCSLLADLYQYLLLCLTETERASIAIYELQTYLVEVSVYPRDYYEGMKFDSFFSWLLQSVKSEPKLWMKHSPVHSRVCKHTKA